MKIGTVIVALLLAFLLFTPHGQSIAEIAMSELAGTSRPVPYPTRTAQEVAACKEAWYATHAHGAYNYAPCD
jgi:hypothetical protein